MKFNLKRPCAACPFTKTGSAALGLRPGRIEDIIESISGDDSVQFVCHKTVVLNPRNPSACVGAIAWQHANDRRLSVGARLAIEHGMLPLATLRALAPEVIEIAVPPEKLKTRRRKK